MFAVERDVGTAARSVFVVGVVLRVLLACLNWEANDDHLAVSRIIADEHRIPDKDELEEAFQPKLYHLIVAALWKGVPTQSPAIRIRLAQFVSCLAGVIVLRVALRFVLKAASLSAKVRFLAFALVALNPCLIGINAQATNDSLVILFVSLSLYYGYRFFDGWRGNDFAWMTLSAILAGLSKGNGVVVFIAILLVFMLACVHRGPSSALTRRQTLLYGAIFVAVSLALVPRLGPYGDYYRRYGSPFVINMSPAPFPHVFAPTFVSRPGVTSLVDALLTFRLLDMLHTPVSTNGDLYPQHRTSLWSQLYGRAHFVHFDAWPPSWQVPEGSGPWATRLVWNLGRLILLCALLPTILLLVALVRRGGSVIRWVIKTQAPPVRLGQGLLDLAVFGYLLFIVVYALRYRSFAVMKAIFLFPAVLGFVGLFAQECHRFYAWCAHHTLLRVATDSVFACLCLLYVVDVLVLIGHLGLQLWTA
jgi:Dolichyl-phosphate-mannose-protein mannosyltransferase